jgi:hypothetical protein
LTFRFVIIHRTPKTAYSKSSYAKTISGRKANSTQKERLVSNKLTAEVGRRDVGGTRGFMSRDRLYAKRPTTAINKKHNFNPKPSKPNLKNQKETFNRTLNNRKANEEKLAPKKYLRKQKSSEGDIVKCLTSKNTPSTVKRKAEKIIIDADRDLRDNEDEEEDASYISGEKSAKKYKFVNDEESTPTSISSHIQGRSTVTPCRYGMKSRWKVFKIEPEAFEQMPNGTEDLTVNLEDIVEEEQVIFSIHESLTK